MKQTVKSLTAMLIINRFRAVLACEFRTTTQQTLKFVNIPTTIKILQKIDKIIISIYTISVNFGLWPLRLVLDCLKFYIYRKHQNHIFFICFRTKIMFGTENPISTFFRYYWTLGRLQIKKKTSPIFRSRDPLLKNSHFIKW